jgi:cobaltochelatase CobS
MDQEDEAQMIEAKAKIHADKAKELVKFATRVRESYDRGEITNTIGPRELLFAAKLGALFGGDFKAGLNRAFINKMPSSSALAVREVCDRIFA